MRQAEYGEKGRESKLGFSAVPHLAHGGGGRLRSPFTGQVSPKWGSYVSRQPELVIKWVEEKNEEEKKKDDCRQWYPMAEPIPLSLLSVTLGQKARGVYCYMQVRQAGVPHSLPLLSPLSSILRVSAECTYSPSPDLCRLTPLPW